MEIINIPNHSSLLLQQLNCLRLNGTLCDVTITGQDGSMPGHRLVLTAASPCFGQYIKSSDVDGAHVVDLSHFDYLLVKTVVESLYTSQLNISKCSVRDVIKVCEELQLKSAVDACNNYLENDNQKSKESDTQTEDVEKLVTEEITTESKSESPVRRKRKATESKKVENAKPKRTRKAYKPRQRKVIPKKVDVVQTIDIATNLIPVKLEENEKNTREVVLNADAETVVKIEKDYFEAEETLEDEFDDYDDNEKNSDTDDYDSNIVDETVVTEDVDENIKTIDDMGKVVKKRGRKKKEITGTAKLKKRRRRKPFPCSMCTKTLTSRKRQIFHEYSKHGTPIDFKSITFTVSPCSVQASISTIISDFKLNYIFLFCYCV